MHPFTRYGAVLVAALSFSSIAIAAPEGHYRGSAGNLSASADLELMDTTLIGILVVGEERYLINASREGDVYNGSASDMTSGKQLPLNIHYSGKRVSMQLHVGDTAITSVELNNAN